jgi:hypothetical protein
MNNVDVLDAPQTTEPKDIYPNGMLRRFIRTLDLNGNVHEMRIVAKPGSIEDEARQMRESGRYKTVEVLEQSTMPEGYYDAV